MMKLDNRHVGIPEDSADLISEMLSLYKLEEKAMVQLAVSHRTMGDVGFYNEEELEELFEVCDNLHQAKTNLAVAIRNATA